MNNDKRLEHICKEAREEFNSLIKTVHKYQKLLPEQKYNELLNLAFNTYKYQPYYAMLYFLAANMEVKYKNEKNK